MGTEESQANGIGGLGEYPRRDHSLLGISSKAPPFQVNLPKALPSVSNKIDRTTTFKHRYAYNYCTHSYSMAFWTEEQWQKEIDFLAMNGVNLVLDILGMEVVYRRFLTQLGYRHREI